MNIETIKNILLSNYKNQDFQACMQSISQMKSIDDSFFDFLLTMNDKVDAVECFFNCLKINEKQFDKLQIYIETNINTQDNELKSDLIELAIFWNIASIFDFCINIVNNPSEPDFVIMTAIEYVYQLKDENQYEKAKEVFIKVLNHEDYYQNCQTLASFYLFRMTEEMEYYNYLKESMTLNDGLNKEILKNVLENDDLNKPPYFDYYDEMIDWVN